MDAARLTEELSPQAGASWPRGRPAVLPKTSLGGQNRMGGSNLLKTQCQKKAQVVQPQYRPGEHSERGVFQGFPILTPAEGKCALGKLHELLQEASRRAVVSRGRAGVKREAPCRGCVIAAPAEALAAHGII